jgi:cytochrome c peroxidase
MAVTKRVFSLIGMFLLIFWAGCKGPEEKAPEGLTKKEFLGKKLFFDTNLSTPPGQACAFCHAPVACWSGPDKEINKAGAVYEGAVPGRFGNRKPPSAAYAGLGPVLHFLEEDENFVGGMFWDGRATGKTLGDPLAEQAMGPFLNPLEQNNPDKKSVVIKVRDSDYADLFEEVWGPGSLDWENDIDGTYERIARSIAAFEKSTEVNPFSSKFDSFWHKVKSTGKDIESIDESNWEEYKGLGLEDDEVEGFMLFVTKGKCAECHVLTPGSNGEPPVFTDFTYDNLGAPRNPENPFYSMPEEWNPEGKDWVDKGLGGFLENTEEYAQYASANYGKQKVPTLRNVDLRPSEDFTKAFLHNGYFKTLKDVVHFYNTRDVEGENWPPPEISANVNKDELGDLGLDEREEDLIVLFMKTLSDGFIPTKEKQ